MVVTSSWHSFFGKNHSIWKFHRERARELFCEWLHIANLFVNNRERKVSILINLSTSGEDIILYLPNNEVDLHGNMSSDDHGIVGWEWTRANSPPGTKELAADTNNMRTPHPHLSNLEEGVYTFSLKVTDAKGQFDEDQVCNICCDVTKIPLLILKPQL